jgi:hypothetical protein
MPPQARPLRLDAGRTDPSRHDRGETPSNSGAEVYGKLLRVSRSQTQQFVSNALSDTISSLSVLGLAEAELGVSRAERNYLRPGASSSAGHRSDELPDAHRLGRLIQNAKRGPSEGRWSSPRC